MRRSVYKNKLTKLWLFYKHLHLFIFLQVSERGKALLGTCNNDLAHGLKKEVIRSYITITAWRFCDLY